MHTRPRSDAKKPDSVPTTAAATPTLKPLDASEKSNKKGKANGKGKFLFQRIWSLDDEITILKAIIEFESKHGQFKHDGAGIKDFHHFVKDSLSLEVNIHSFMKKNQEAQEEVLDDEITILKAIIEFESKHDLTYTQLYAKNQEAQE